jgi:hypothetical protein
MAVGVLIMFPEGAGQAEYEAVTKKMLGSLTPSETPDGLIVHTAGQSPQGWYVYDVWESKEDFERFAQEKVGPASEAVMGEPMQVEPTFYEVSNLIRGK